MKFEYIQLCVFMSPAIVGICSCVYASWGCGAHCTRHPSTCGFQRPSLPSTWSVRTPHTLSGDSLSSLRQPLASTTCCLSLRACPCRTPHWNGLAFQYLLSVARSVPLNAYGPFVYPSGDRHVGCLHFGAVVNSAAEKRRPQDSVWTQASISRACAWELNPWIAW